MVPRMVYFELKSPCRISYWSSIENIALNCLIFWENRVFVYAFEANEQMNRHGHAIAIHKIRISAHCSAAQIGYTERQFAESTKDNFLNADWVGFAAICIGLGWDWRVMTQGNRLLDYICWWNGSQTGSCFVLTIVCSKRFSLSEGDNNNWKKLLSDVG